VGGLKGRLRQLRVLAHKRQVEQELDEELAIHIEMETEKNIRAGMSPAEARRAALIAFGGVERTKERVRDARWTRWIEDLVADGRHAVRFLSRTPTFTGVAVLTLALGIAALTTVWGAVDILVLRPYPYDLDDSLVLIGTSTRGRGNPGSPTSIPDFLDLRAQLRSVRVAAYKDEGANLGADPATWVSVRRASADFFDVVGVAPVLGRTFTASDETAGAPDVAVLDHGLWERRFGSDPDVLGRSILMEGTQVTVVGVLPPGFRFSRGAPELWLPLHVTGSEARGFLSVYVFGRLHGADIQAARTELASMSRTLAERHPESWSERTFLSGGLRETLTGGSTARQGISAILLASLAVLLIACANVANLLLARALVREGDLVLRRALGAGRWRIARQVIAEAFVLATAAGIVGLALSVLGMRGFRTLLPPELPRAGEIALDGRSAALAMLAAWGSVLVFSLAPTLRSLRISARVPSSSGRGPAGRGSDGGRLRSAFVVGEVALAATLLAVTILVARSLSAIRGLDTGFTVEHVVAFDVSLPENRYPDEDALEQAAARLAAALDDTPGVELGGVGVGLPGRNWRSASYLLPGGASDEGEGEPLRVAIRYASPGYLRTLGIETVRGRMFTAVDDAASTHVALVNHRFAERVWPGMDPVGRTLVLGGENVEVVGVLPDLLEFGPFGSFDMAYLPLAQWPSRQLSVVAHVPGGPKNARTLAETVVARVDPTLAPHGVAEMKDILLLPADQTVAMGKVMSVLSAVALILALVGVFGSVTYSVSQRVPEIGVRMALGAAPGHIQAMVLAGAARLFGTGLAIGTVLALLAARGVTAFLYGIQASDPSTFIGSGILLVVVGLGAAWIPARRASTVDPARSLRSEG
jgi:putative ABC transport system permease protein